MASAEIEMKATSSNQGATSSSDVTVNVNAEPRALAKIEELIQAASRGGEEDIAAVERLAKEMNVNLTNVEGRTALHVASSEGHVAMAEKLIELGALVSAKDNHGFTPLDCAAQRRQEAMCEALAAKGGKFGDEMAAKMSLFEAVAQDDATKIRCLLKAKVDIYTAIDADRRNPLHIALAERKTNATKLLLDYDSKHELVGKMDSFGRTPQTMATQLALEAPSHPINEFFPKDAAHGGEAHTAHHNHSNKWAWFFLGFEVILIVLQGIFAEYSHETGGKVTPVSGVQEMAERYPYFQDVHVMIFIGFGFLMTFLRRNLYSSLGYTFLVSAFCIQWYPLVITFWEGVLSGGDFHQLYWNIEYLIRSDFCAGAVMITFGVLLGKVSVFQIMFIAVWEVVFFALNEEIGLKMKITDLGGSMVIHTFGAVFGLTATLFMSPKETGDNDKKKDNAAVYHTDTFAMIGTIFLWLFWPSFNGALGLGVTQQRAAVNTVLSLTGSCMTAFIFSWLLRHEFSMVDVQNATLAGGVAMGTCADLIIWPGSAIAIGAIAGTVSVLGYVYLKDWLEAKLHLYDTCGVMNLHCMPGIIGALAGVIASGAATEEDYGADQLAQSFWARDGTADARTAGKQAGIQFAYLCITLGIAISSGWLGALIARLEFFDPLPVDKLFSDESHWEVPRKEIPFNYDPMGNESNQVTMPFSKFEAQVMQHEKHLADRMAELEARLNAVDRPKQL